MGYFVFLSSLFSFSLTLLVLHYFKLLFKQVQSNNPFSTNVVMRLKRLAVVFVLMDILIIVYFIVLSTFLSGYVKTHFFQLDLWYIDTTNAAVGGNFIIGTIIYIVAIIFQRGIELQEENALTV